MADRTIKLEHFKNLVAVASADNYLDEAEKEFLSQKATDAGLSIAEVDRIMEDAENIRFEVPYNLEEKEEQLSDAVYMAMVDGEIADKEYHLCTDLASHLGLSQNDVDEVIRIVKKLWKR